MMSPPEKPKNVFEQSPPYTGNPAAYVIPMPNAGGQYNVQPAPPGYFTTIPKEIRLAEFHQAFLKGKPYALGIVLVVSAFLQIGLAILLIFLAASITVYSGVAFWGAIFYIIAGSLSIEGYKTPSVCKVRGSLGLSIMSSISSMIGAILNVMDFLFLDCDGDHYEYFYFCLDGRGSGAFIVIAFHFILNLLVFCLSVSLSVFGCRALDKAPSSSSPQILIIQNDVIVPMPPPSNPPQSSGIHMPPPLHFVQQD